MAELGHPIIGPQSINKLTPGEIRIYAEGLKHRNDRQEEEAAYQQATAGGGTAGTDPGPSYNTETKQKRDQQALQTVEQRAQNQHQQS